MRRPIVLAALFALAGPALADQKTLTLRFLPPSRLVTLLSAPGGPGVEKGLLPAGIERLDPDDEKGALTVYGSAEAIARLVEMVGFLDVRAKIVRIEATLSRGDVVLTRPVLLTRNNEPIRVQVGDAVIALVAHVNGDNTLSIAFDDAMGAARNVVRVKQRESATVALKNGGSVTVSGRVVEEPRVGAR